MLDKETKVLIPGYICNVLWISKNWSPKHKTTEDIGLKRAPLQRDMAYFKRGFES